MVEVVQAASYKCRRRAPTRPSRPRPWCNVTHPSYPLPSLLTAWRSPTQSTPRRRPACEACLGAVQGSACRATTHQSQLFLSYSLAPLIQTHLGHLHACLLKP
eukprot:5144899-Pleurochrysis_carterae.AAC.1